jgi:hypothetical protein
LLDKLLETKTKRHKKEESSRKCRENRKQETFFVRTFCSVDPK